MEITEVLNLKFKSNDLNKTLTVKEFFKKLLLTLWEEKECFSGKRPFGNSGWDSDIEICFIKNKLIKGKLDEDGYIESSDYVDFDKLINKCIKAL